MENPSTWGEAEHVVRKVLDEFRKNQNLRFTDPDKMFFGLSLERQITDALREAGLLVNTNNNTENRIMPPPSTPRPPQAPPKPPPGPVRTPSPNPKGR